MKQHLDSELGTVVTRTRHTVMHDVATLPSPDDSGPEPAATRLTVRRSDAAPIIMDRPEGKNVIVKTFVFIPFLALAAAVPIVWGWGLSWVDVSLAGFFYFLTLGGATVGFHRYFTHRSFKAHRPLRVALAVVGSMALQGPVITWVADHRRHHAFTDREGDPHSPWLFGTSPAAVAKGFWHSHFGWMLRHEVTNPDRFAPDLLVDHEPPVPAVDRDQPRRAGSARWTDHLVVVGCTDSLLLGRPRARRRAPPHDLVGQLDLSYGRQTAVDAAGPLHELLATGHRHHGRVMAQPAPRRPHLRPPRRRAWADRHVGPCHRLVREAGLGL